MSDECCQCQKKWNIPLFFICLIGECGEYCEKGKKHDQIMRRGKVEWQKWYQGNAKCQKNMPWCLHCRPDTSEACYHNCWQYCGCQNRYEQDINPKEWQISEFGKEDDKAVLSDIVRLLWGNGAIFKNPLFRCPVYKCIKSKSKWIEERGNRIDGKKM